MVTGRERSTIQAEAAAWLARLHSPSKSAVSEGAFRTWLEQDERHREEFEKATEVWDLIGSVPRPADAANDARPNTRSWAKPLMALAASFVLILTTSLLLLQRDPVYETAIGEQQVVVLTDGTRVALNTNSEVSVDYDQAERSVVLEHGEALFEVSHDAARPFIVVAGNQIIRALGTKFVVRRDGDDTRVTLLEGKVEVRGPSAARRAPLAVLAPGQRVTVTANAGAALDTPPLDAVTAWRRGEVVFEDSSLVEAAEELNRYSDRRLIIADPSVGSMRVSGVFSTGDVGEVAKAIAELHGLKVETDGRDYKLKAS